MQTSTDNNAGTRLPRLLNQDFTVHFYDGGVFGEGSGSTNFDIKNVLFPTREAFHCSDSGTKKNLVLKCSSEFILTHLFIQAPRRKCTEPINHCLVWVSEDEPDIASTRYLDDLPIELIKNKFDHHGEFDAGDPVVISTSRDTLEGEIEFRPMRLGHYVHLKFFDTHSDVQENIDIAVVGLVGWVEPLPLVSLTRASVGTWLKRQVTLSSVHAHPLLLTFSNRGWCCDGRDFSGGCRSGFSDFNETSVFDVSFRCVACGFDLCELCVNDANSLGRVTPMSASWDLKAIRNLVASGRSIAQQRRLAFHRVSAQLQTDPGALIAYLEAGLIDVVKSKLKFFQKDATNLLAILLSRLGGVSNDAPPLFRPDLYLYMDPEGEWRYVQRKNHPTLPPHLLLLAANTEQIVRTTAEAIQTDHQSGDFVDWSIPTGEGPREPESGVCSFQIDIQEESSSSFRTCADWFCELQTKLFNPLLDLLALAQPSDLVHAFVLVNRGENDFDDRLRLLTLRLLNGPEPRLGLRLLASYKQPVLAHEKLWVDRVGDDDSACVSIRNKQQHNECPGEMIELLLVTEALPTTEEPTGVLNQLALPMNVELGSAGRTVRVTPLSTLGSMARYVLASNPVCDLEYLCYCHGLVGSTVTLSPANSSWRVVAFGLMTDFHIGMHTLQNSDEQQCIVNLALVSYTVTAGEEASSKSALAGAFSYVRLMDPSLDLWDQLNTPGVVIASSELVDIILEHVPGLGRTRERNWLVPQSGLSPEIVSQLKLTPGEPHRSTSSSMSASSFSVGILVDVNEVPFQLLWPIIRDEVTETVRPFLSRTFRGQLPSFLRLEQLVAAGVAANGIGVVARRLSREEADGVSAQLAGVIQSTVFEEEDRVVEQSDGWKLGTRIKGGGVVASGKKPNNLYDVIDEISGELRQEQIDNESLGDSLRRRFFSAEGNVSPFGGQFITAMPFVRLEGEENDEEGDDIHEEEEEPSSVFEFVEPGPRPTMAAGLTERMGIMSRLIAASDLFRSDVVEVVSSEVIAGGVPGIAKGLNAPVVARYSADDLAAQPAVPAPEVLVRSQPNICVHLYSNGEWIPVNPETSMFPYMSLRGGSRVEWRIVVATEDPPSSRSSNHPLKKRRTDDNLRQWTKQLRELGNLEASDILEILKTVLAKRVSALIDDHPALVVSNALTGGTSLPPWLTELPIEFPLLFSAALRQRIFRLTSFPAAMTVHWIQQGRVGELLSKRAQIQSDLNEAEGRRMQQLSQELSNVEERIGRNPWWLGCVECVLARLRKSDDSLLHMTSSLMNRLSASAMLEIQFEGETGFGSAVTRSFFAELAKEISKQNSLWLTTGSVPRRGLSLRPYHSVPETIVDSCILLGRLIGRAVMEGYIFPLQLSLSTWAMIRDPRSVRANSGLPCPGDDTCGEFVGACVLAGDNVGPLLDSVGAVFLETGFGGAELVPGGGNVSVTRGNVFQFIELARTFYLYTGIEAQLSAIRSGISSVVKLESLMLFSPEELRTLVCGEDEIVWDEAGLKEILCFHFDSGDMQESWLISILLEMDNKARSTFLDFVTSCPRLPPQLKIEVFAETIASSNLTSPVLRPASPPRTGASSPLEDEVVGYPRSRACVNHLYLPRYKARETLKERLTEAMVSSVHHDEIT